MPKVISLNDLIIKYFINNNISKVTDKIENHNLDYYNNAEKVDYKASSIITIENTFNNLLAKEKRHERRK